MNVDCTIKSHPPKNEIVVEMKYTAGLQSFTYVILKMYIFFLVALVHLLKPHLTFCISSIFKQQHGKKIRFVLISTQCNSL